jgi:carboxyl-terminal processing protease
MSHRFRRSLAIGLLVATPIVATGFLRQSRDATDGATLFNQVLQSVAMRFVDTVDASALYEKAARGLVTQLNDPYTVLFTPKERAEFTQSTNGRYAGVGMAIEDIRGNITVSRVFPGSPASQAAVQDGDRIVMIDTASTRGWKTEDVSNRLKGEPGTPVRVRFQRPGVTEPINVTFRRAVIHIPAVPFATMVSPGIGYIPVQTFNETASQEVVDAMRRLQTQGMRAMILDLRDNPGGLLDEAFAMSNLFLPRGKEILSVRGRAGMSQQYTTEDEPLAPQIPLVVLQDEQSASASEIVSGALQDHDRAVIVGTTSFGKGLVQSMMALDGGYALKITTGKWFTPSGRTIQRPRRVVDGRFIEDAPADSIETDSARRARPAFKSAGGRVVYGGGGIAPDVAVNPDTLTTVEQRAARQLAGKLQEAFVALAQYAEELKPQLNGMNFNVQPAWRSEYFRRLKAGGVPVDSATFFAAPRYVDRIMGQRIAKYAYGDSAGVIRNFKEDTQLQRAIELLSRSRTQRDLFSVATPGTQVGVPATRARP